MYFMHDLIFLPEIVIDLCAFIEFIHFLLLLYKKKTKEKLEWVMKKKLSTLSATVTDTFSSASHTHTHTETSTFPHWPQSRRKKTLYTCIDCVGKYKMLSFQANLFNFRMLYGIYCQTNKGKVLIHAWNTITNTCTNMRHTIKDGWQSFSFTFSFLFVLFSLFILQFCPGTISPPTVFSSYVRVSHPFCFSFLIR